MYSLAIGLIVLFVGVAMMYMLPELIIYQLNETDIFPVADVATALDQAEQVRAIGFVVIIIAVIWMLISIISSKGGQ